MYESMYIWYIHSLGTSYYIRDSSSVANRGVGNSCSLPQAPSVSGPPNSAQLIQIHIPSSLRVFVLFCFVLMLLGRKLQCPHLMCLLHSPLARAQYVILFDLTLLNKDN